MSLGNYPDDIRSYDHDSRSPFYDTSEDDAIQDLKAELADLFLSDLVCNNGINIDKIVADTLSAQYFDYFEFLIELSYTLQGTDKCIQKVILKGNYTYEKSKELVEHLLDHLEDEITEKCTVDPDDYDGPDSDEF